MHAKAQSLWNHNANHLTWERSAGPLRLPLPSLLYGPFVLRLFSAFYYFQLFGSDGGRSGMMLMPMIFLALQEKRFVMFVVLTKTKFQQKEVWILIACVVRYLCINSNSCEYYKLWTLIWYLRLRDLEDPRSYSSFSGDCNPQMKHITLNSRVYPTRKHSVPP